MTTNQLRDASGIAAETDAGLEVRGLSKTYGTLRILENINLRVPPGGSLAILGPTGCGKTTLLRCIAGLEKPESGMIRNGERWLFREGISLPPAERGVAMAFQQPCLWPHLTVAANVAFAVSHLPKPERKERTAWVLDLLGITELADRHPAEISGGQARRASLARALAPRAPLLLLDEPLVNLDSESRRTAQDSINKARSGDPFTLLLVTHDAPEAEALCDRTCVFNDRCQ
jgi:iron(III) transport system ATP-binding protein